MDVREVGIEARVPNPATHGFGPAEDRAIFRIRTEASRTDHRATPASQALLGGRLPLWAFEVAAQDLSEAVRVEALRDPLLGTALLQRSLLQVSLVGIRKRQALDNLPPGIRAGLYQESMSATRGQFSQPDVEALARRGGSSEGGTKAGRHRLSTIDHHEKEPASNSFVVRIDVCPPKNTPSSTSIA